MGNGNLYGSSDGGTTWSSQSGTHHNQNVTVSPTGTVFYGYEYSGGGEFWSTFSTSTDGGLSWNPVPCCIGGGAFAFTGHCVVTAGYHGIIDGPCHAQLSLSLDDGQTWISKGEPPCWRSSHPLAICPNGNTLCHGVFAGNTGLLLSADSGSSWTRVSTVIPGDILPTQEGGTLVGTDTLGIFLFSDNGDSIRTVNEGLINLYVHTLAQDSLGYVYAGTDSGVWRRPLSELVSVKLAASELPTEFTLHQNFPNPFNPSTTIRYALPHILFVTLTVHNTLGQQVARLVDDQQQTGYHEAVFRGDGLASGVYFYRLQAGSFVGVKKFILLK